MLHVYNENNKYVKEMGKALEAANVDSHIENVRSYCFRLQNHIYKEGNVCYPKAENALD